MSNKDNGSSIARSSAVMAAGTLASRLLGLVRNALLIAALGATASGAAEAFNIANNLPTQLYNLVIGGVLNAILVPQIVQALRQRNGEELVNRLLTAASVAMATVSAVLTVCAPLVIMLYASGLDRWQPLAFAFAFWCMPQIFFYGLYALWGQVLNARSSFGPYMWSPVLNNIISIASIMAYLHIYGHYASGQDPGIWNAGRIALVGATTTAGIAIQALILYIPLVRSGFHPRFVWGVRGMGLGTMSKVALWALLGTAVVSLGDIATANLGSQAVTAAESAQYADQIVPSKTLYDNTQLVYMLPQSLVTTSIITALFTRMSEKAAAGDRGGVRDDLSLGLRSVAVFTILFAAGIGTLATPSLQLFVPSLSLAEATAAGPILTVLAIGIIFQGIWFTTQRVMLAYADTKRLLIADSVVGIVPAIVCLVAYLATPANHWMTWAAAGSMLSQVGGSVAVIPLIRRHLPDLDGPRVIATYARLAVAAIPAVLVGLGVRALLGPADGSLTGSRPTDAMLTVIVAALLMTATYLAAARLLRVEELGVLFVPLSRIVAKIGRLLPGRAGEAVLHLAHLLAPTSADRAGTELPPSYPPTYRPMLRAVDAPRPAPAPPPAIPAPPPTFADLAAQAASVRALTPGTLAPHALGLLGTGGGSIMTDATPIGTGRYALAATLPATLPRVVRHVGRDTILDRTVTILMLTDATPHRAEVLESASRAVLVEDRRIQRVLDVETHHPAFVVTEPADGRPLSALVGQGLNAAQVRAIVGEVAQALDACSRRGLHHLNLSPESVRLRSDGTVQVTGIGVEAAILGLDSQAASNEDPLEADRIDARALVELLYYGLTKRWPGKRAGLPSAPTTSDGAPVPPSMLATTMGADDADLDELVARTWSDEEPMSASQIAQALGSWDASLLPRATAEAMTSADSVASATSGASAPSGASTTSAASASPSSSTDSTNSGASEPALKGVLSRLRRAAATRQEPAAVVADPVPAEPQTDAVPRSFAPAAAEPRTAAGPPTGIAPPEAGGSPTAAQGSPLVGNTANTTSTAPAFQPPSVPLAAQSAAPPVNPVNTEEALQVSGDPDGDDEVERSVSRTTMAIISGMLVVMLVGAIFAVNSVLGLFDLPFTEPDVPAASTVPSTAAHDTQQTPSETTEPTAEPITITSAKAVDQGGSQGDHPENEGKTVDGNPATTWESQFYRGPKLANLKSGTGIAVTLDKTSEVSGIDIQGTGQGGNVQVRATSPEDPTGGTVLAEGAFTSGTTSFTFSPTKTQSIVIWVTDQPTAPDGESKVTVSEITFK